MPESTVTVTDENSFLTEEQKQIICQYGKIYMDSLITLEAGNVSGLYYDTESEPYYINKAALEIITTVRGMSDKDLKIEYYNLEYTVTDIYAYGDTMYIDVLENNEQKFNFMDKPSESFILQHEFVLKKYDDKWYIHSHTQDEDFFLMAEEAWVLFSGTPQQKYEKVMDAVISDTEENILWAKENYYNKSEEKTADDISYDVEAAIAYAEEWVGERNYDDNYLAYDEYGGNCQNFASQCLYAGGLDMDIKGYTGVQWKYYSKTLNERATSSGRSYSWTGVVPFFEYCEFNSGSGLVTHTDWGIAYTEKGDVIQVGAMHEWRHSLFVTDVIYDEDGYAEEIIVASNTADRLNYPLSAYIYTAPRLIHIVGQNV